MQVAFYLAGEITQVKESIPGVRCASGNVFYYFHKPNSNFGFFWHSDIMMRTNVDHTDSQILLPLLNSKNFPVDKNGSYIYMSNLWQPPTFHDNQHLHDRVFSWLMRWYWCWIIRESWRPNILHIIEKRVTSGTKMTTLNDKMLNPSRLGGGHHHVFA